MNTAEKIEALPVEDYLDSEPHAQIRHEYIGGHLFAMAGGSQNHNRITVNLVVLLDSALADGPCRVFVNDMRAHIQLDDIECFYYPDVMVACGPQEPQKPAVDNPRLIIEVLSDSTERVDRAEKLMNYIRLDSLDEYVLAAQDRPVVTVFRRSNDWRPEAIQGLESEVHLESIKVTARLSRIYRGVEL